MSPESHRIPPTLVCDAARALDTLAPTSLAQSWDNVGLLAGDSDAICRRILLCIDLTPPVLDEAVETRADLVVAYHPPIFRPVQRFLATGGAESLVFRAAAKGIAIYSPHTALDAAPGGTNDVIAGLCGLRDVRPFEYVSPGRPQFKLVTFVPPAQLDTVANALFAAGAGRIGEYEQCSYRLSGEGTFFGTESTNPAVGRKGRLELVEETRIEVIVPQRSLPDVVTALRRSHPYEEPAFDIYPLAPEPVAGIGRAGSLPQRLTLGLLGRRLATATGSKVTTLVGDPRTPARRAAVCVGAAGRLPLEKPYSSDCDVIVTGEIRHHDALTLLREGKTAVALGHWESERPVLRPLTTRLKPLLPGVAITISRRDRAPFQPV